MFGLKIRVNITSCQCNYADKNQLRVEHLFNSTLDIRILKAGILRQVRPFYKTLYLYGLINAI